MVVWHKAPDSGLGHVGFHFAEDEASRHVPGGNQVCEPTSIQHEGPSRRLVQMATRFEIVRGSRIACFGSGDLVRVDAAGRWRWLMQADEVLYLHPDRMQLRGPAIDVDADDFRRRVGERRALRGRHDSPHAPHGSVIP